MNNLEKKLITRNIKVIKLLSVIARVHSIKINWYNVFIIFVLINCVMYTMLPTIRVMGSKLAMPPCSLAPIDLSWEKLLKIFFSKVNITYLAFC